MQLWQKQADGNFLRTIGSFRMIVQPKPIYGEIRVPSGMWLERG